ncbi:hypothetical protein [Spirosoma foliorum]|uniref:Uncharacterized protein n=1 Tax=Spirosoma foliorum TaxID=2710596 RepID=A0A7G5H6H5_9BACT|nr:hypothetical protein [Spirosoma foliorum]QMW06717.1 hypothetical protein H3H32_18395 [Spirosoma foliorum]
MMMVIFLAISPTGEYRSLAYGAPNIEMCFEALTMLPNKGWQLIHIELIDDGQHTLLPIDAFDGRPLKKPLEKLRQEWELILA